MEDYKVIQIVVSVVALLITAFGLFKLPQELSQFKFQRYRENYRFAKEFMTDLKNDPTMDPRLRARALFGLVGSQQIKPEILEYLWSLKDYEAISTYRSCQQYLEYDKTTNNCRLVFRKRFKTNFSRWWRRKLFLTLYGFSLFATFLPFWISFFLPHTPTISASILHSLKYTIPYFGATAVLFLVAGKNLSRAERIVNNQERHQCVQIPESRSPVQF